MDNIIQTLAVRLYTLHRAIESLQIHSGSYLHREMDICQSNIENHGGKVIWAKQNTLLSTSIPTVVSAHGDAVPYSTGRMEAERFIQAIIDASGA